MHTTNRVVTSSMIAGDCVGQLRRVLRFFFTFSCYTTALPTIFSTPLFTSLLSLCALRNVVRAQRTRVLLVTTFIFSLRFFFSIFASQFPSRRRRQRRGGYRWRGRRRKRAVVVGSRRFQTTAASQQRDVIQHVGVIQPPWHLLRRRSRDPSTVHFRPRPRPRPGLRDYPRVV